MQQRPSELLSDKLFSIADDNNVVYELAGSHFSEDATITVIVTYRDKDF